MKQKRTIPQRILMARLRAERRGQPVALFPPRARAVKTSPQYASTESTLDLWLATHLSIP